jgi:hypothetical protein
LQRLLKRLERWGVRLFCTDDWAPYDTALPAGRHYIGKDQTQRSESNNACSCWMNSGSPADCVMPVPCQAAWRIRLRSRLKPARPYMVRLIVFSRLIWPSTGLVDHGVSSAA